MHPIGPLHIVGVSHRQAELQHRERLALSPESLRVALEDATDRRSRVVLSTCNRFEIYWWGDHDWEPWLHELAERTEGQLPRTAVFRHHGRAAARHLFTVATGFDSQILGETEIQGQVRRAWDLAKDVGTTCPELDTVFAAALAAGRRIRRNTFLDRHPASIGRAAVRAALGNRGTLEGASVLVLGAGTTARSLRDPLTEAGVGCMRVATRTPERVRDAFPAAGVVAWAELDEALAGADVLFGAVATPRSVLTAARVAAARTEAGRPLLIIDLGVPRNVDPDAANLPGVHLLDLDDLRGGYCPESAPGSAAMREADALLQTELDRLPTMLGGVSAADRLADLHRYGHRLAEEEVALALRQLGSNSEREALVVQQLAERLVRRLLYPASRQLRDTG